MLKMVAEVGEPYLVRSEALSLSKLVGRNGNTVETVRELIAVEPEEERQLLAFAQHCPEEEPFIRRALRFRQAVASQFELLVGCDSQFST